MASGNHPLGSVVDFDEILMLLVQTVLGGAEVAAWHEFRQG